MPRVSFFLLPGQTTSLCEPWPECGHPGAGAALVQLAGAGVDPEVVALTRGVKASRKRLQM